MKLMQNERVWGLWKPATVTGFCLNTTGVGLGALSLHQLLSGWVQGNPNALSGGVVLLMATVSIILMTFGFGLMVLGSDPFEDVSGQFTAPEPEE